MIAAIIGGFTILGALLTFVTFVNGRSIKKLIKELHRDTSEQVRRMDERTEKITELIRKMDERMEKMDERMERITELIIETRNLIVTEGDKTRELIKTLKG
jgi:methyl-accepting chemotaxis protein